MVKKGKKSSKEKFRPCKQPRYIPGLVSDTIWKSDLENFNKHKYNVFTATPKVDATPPPMNPHDYVKPQRLLGDASRLRQIDNDNRELLKKINKINRTTGKVDTFNPIAYTTCSKWRTHELNMLQIVKNNKQVYKRLSAAESAYSTKKLEEDWKETVKAMKYTAKMPLTFLSKKTIDQELREKPSISEGLEATVERPMCFMDFRVKDGVYLGRIVIELYFDFVPVTVQNFLSLCRGENGLTYKNCPVHRVIKGKYMETGDITKGNGKGGMSIYGKTFDEENFTLKHSKAGVLSMIAVDKKVNNSQFSITFREMEQLDGKRVVFGKVVKGNSTIFKIEDLGRKVGAPSAPINIVDCGEFIKGQTPARILLYKY